MLALNYGAMAGTGSPQVQRLQEALKALAQISGKPAIDPGGSDGIVGTRTINAVVSAMSLLTAHLGGAAVPLQAGLTIYAISDHARAAAMITSYAPQLEAAARAAALAVARGQQPAAAPPPGMMPMPTGTPWYKTWWGIGAIAVGGLGVIVLLLGPSRPRAAAPM